MVMLALRFDLRNPAFAGVSSSERLRAAVDMAAWADEFEMFGVPLAERGRRTTEIFETLRKAWTGEPFEYRGRTVQVTPLPHRPGGPPLVLGGSSDVAARRAARIADGFAPVSGDCWPAYRDECVALGKPDPGPAVHAGPMVTTFLAEDPDEAWDRLVPHFLHETNAYGTWLDDAGLEGPYEVTTAERVRVDGRYRILTPDAYADELRAMGEGAFAFFHPMVGGVPPAMAWECLHLYEAQVLPALGAR